MQKIKGSPVASGALGCLCYKAVPSVKESSFCYADCMTPVHRKQMDGDEQLGPQLSTLWSNPHPVPGAA